MWKKIFFLTVVFFSFHYFASSQEVKSNSILEGWSLNVNGGISLLWGDVETTLKDDFRAKPCFGLFIGKRLSSVFELRGQISKGSLSGSKPAYNYYFDADFFTYNLNTTLSFSRLIFGNNPDRKINIYGIAGIGFIHYRSLLKKITDDVIISNSAYKSAVASTPNEWETESVIPLGVGISYKLGDKFEINAENLWNVVNSDRVDAKIGGYKYDVVSYTSIGLTYKFNLCKKSNSLKDKKADVSSNIIGDTLPKDKLIEKVKYLEDQVGQLDSKVKLYENENKNREAEEKDRVEKLKKDIYKSIRDTLQPSNTNYGEACLPFPIFFNVNKYDILESENEKLASIAELMTKEKNLTLRVIGRTDQSGTDIYNDYLGRKRAEAVVNVLVNKYKITESRFIIENREKSNPFLSEDYYSVNRRVDFIKK